MDGTKIKSNASDSQTSTKKHLENILEALRSKLSEYLSKLQENSNTNEESSSKINVEEAFGQIKYNRNFMRFSVRGFIGRNFK